LVWVDTAASLYTEGYGNRFLFVDNNVVFSDDNLLVDNLASNQVYEFDVGKKYFLTSTTTALPETVLINQAYRVLCFNFWLNKNTLEYKTSKPFALLPSDAKEEQIEENVNVLLISGGLVAIAINALVGEQFSFSLKSTIRLLKGKLRENNEDCYILYTASNGAMDKGSYVTNPLESSIAVIDKEGTIVEVAGTGYTVSSISEYDYQRIFENTYIYQYYCGQKWASLPDEAKEIITNVKTKSNYLLAKVSMSPYTYSFYYKDNFIGLFNINSSQISEATSAGDIFILKSNNDPDNPNQYSVYYRGSLVERFVKIFTSSFVSSTRDCEAILLVGDTMYRDSQIFGLVKYDLITGLQLPIEPIEEEEPIDV
jgi:hypothetical protein